MPGRTIYGRGHRAAGCRHAGVTATLLVLALATLGGPVAAQGTPSPGAAGELRAVGIDSRVRRSIDRALEYLLRQQNPDGSWTDFVGRKVHYYYECHRARHVGVTALAGMAFLSAGALPGKGPQRRYCEAVRRALDFVMAQQDETGYISAYGTRMYTHAFATLFLAEVYGTGIASDAVRVRESLAQAVRLIVRAQNEKGGWRYTPQARDSDMSVTVCQVMALRAARNAGIQVPRETIDAAVRYVRRSFDPRGGGFRYQVYPEYAGRSRVSFALTACGVTTLYGAGRYDAFEIRQGLDYLWGNRFDRQGTAHRLGDFEWFYGQYYAVQAAFQAGGDYWERWYEFIRGELLGKQNADGSWEDLVGPNYATSMAVIILQLPNQYLPITES